MIAKKITVARQEKKEIIHKLELPKLSTVALIKVASNFMLYPELKGLDHKSKLKVYDKTIVDHPIEVIFPLIDYENFWQRACETHFKGEDCALHGNSWKQCYAENYIKKLISNYNPEKGDVAEDIIKYFDIMKFFIFNLEVPTFSSEFNIGKIPQYLVNLTSLELKYSPILADFKKEDILRRKLTPIQNEYTKFGMRMADLKLFTVSLGELSYLLNLSLQGNIIDDEMITWLVSGLICNHTIRYLDLSNNKIADKGMIKISSYLMRSRSLISIDLTNNQIGSRGGFALSLIIKESTMLKYMKLNMNRFDDECGSKIVKALARNESLEELEMASNEFETQTSRDLAIGLRENKNLKFLDFSFNKISLNDETKELIASHPSLIRLELSNTKCSPADVNYVDSCLVKKSVTQTLSRNQYNKTNKF